MKAPISALPLVVLIAAVAAGALPGCAPPPEPGEAALGVTMTALRATCGEGDAAIAAGTSGNLRAEVRGPNVDGEVELLASASGAVQVGGAGLTVEGVPEGIERELTLTGTLGGAPVFARERNIDVGAKQELNLDLTLLPAGKGCLEVPADYPNLLFPAVAALDDGRVVVAGGFQTASPQGGSNDTFDLQAPSDKVYIYDGRVGTFSRVPGVMSEARGGATAVVVPSRNQVVIMGGASRMTYRLGQGRFPFSFVAGDALRSYDVLDLDNLTERLGDPASTAEIFVTPPNEASSGLPNQMTVGRVFPRAVRLEQDDAILVTGGGSWPRGAGVTEAEYWHPRAFDGHGGFVDPHGSLVVNSVRAGHTFTRMGVTADGFARALVWGGTPNDAGMPGEVFIQGSSTGALVSGVFVALVVEGNVPPPYFHAAASISPTRTLIAGGVSDQGSALTADAANRAYVLDFREEAGTPIVRARLVPGLTEGRYFPVIGVTADRRYATVLGGWNGDQAVAPSGVFVADLTAPIIEDDGTGTLVERAPFQLVLTSAVHAGGGMGAAVMSNDALFWAGGGATPTDFATTAVGVAQTWVPSALAGVQ